MSLYFFNLERNKIKLNFEIKITGIQNINQFIDKQ